MSGTWRNRSSALIPVLVGAALTVVACTAQPSRPPPSPSAAAPPTSTTPLPDGQPPTSTQLPSVPTLFGSTLWQAPGETGADALVRLDATFGPLRAVRLYSDGLPPDWSEIAAQVGHRPVVVSFKAEPAEVLSGVFDDELGAWLAAAPASHPTFWTYFHEPEDDVERGSFTAAEFAAAWSHVARLAAQTGNDRLVATVVLMCWTVNPASGRDWQAYAPPAELVDVLAWDCYAHGDSTASYIHAGQLLGPAIAASAELGADWGIAELGARIAGPDAADDRARWLATVGDAAREQQARFVTYFDSPVGGDFQLRDRESIAAWAELVAG